MAKEKRKQRKRTTATPSLGLGTMEGATRRAIEWLFLALLFLAPVIFSMKATTYSITKFILAQLFILLLLVLWLLYMNAKGSFRLADSPLNLPILFLFSFACLSLIKATNHMEGQSELYRLAAWITLYFVVLNTVRWEAIPRIVAATSAAGFIVSLYGILQFWGQGFLHSAAGYLQRLLERSMFFLISASEPVSTLGNINFAGQFLVMAIPLALASFLWAPSLGKKIFYGIASTTMFIHLLCTKCRGGWVGLAGALLFMAIVMVKAARRGEKSWLWSKRTLQAGAILLLLIAATFIISPKLSSWGRSLSEEARSAFNMRQHGVRFRILAWGSTLEMFRDNPFLGVSYGNFKIVYPTYRKAEEYQLSGRGSRVDRAHNDYLQVAAETGIPGLISFLWLLYALGRVARRALRKLEGYSYGLSLGFLISLLAILIHAIFSFPLRNPASSVAFWSFLGVLGLMGGEGSAIMDRKPATGSLKRRRLLVWITAFLLLIVLPGAIVRPLRAEFHVQKGHIHDLGGLEARKRGDPEMAQRKWKEAELEYRKAMAIEPHCRAAHFLCGVDLIRQGRRKEAIKEYEEVLRIHPHYPEAHYNIALLYRSVGQADEAIVHMEETVKLNALYESAYVSLGDIYAARNESDKAIRVYEKALQINPGRAATYYSLGNIFGREEKYERAIEHLEKGLKASSSPFAGLYNGLGSAYFKKGQYDKAIEVFQKSLKIDPENVLIRSALGTAYMEAGKAGEAIDCFKKAIEMDPNYAGAYNNLGYLYTREGVKDLEKALRLIRKALEIEPNCGPFHDSLGWVYYKKGDMEKAMENLERAVSLDGDNPEIRKHLAEVYMAVDRREEADAELKKAGELEKGEE